MQFLKNTIRGWVPAKVSTPSIFAMTLVLAGGQGVHAQSEFDGLETIVVTAERRETNLQTTPVTISAFTADKLQRLQATEAAELTKFVPSLTIQQGIAAPGKIDLYMRGAGDQLGAIITSESGVGIYIDDVFIPRLSVGNVELIELERVEVLRGPQGTLYGRNSMTGAIKFVTKTPTGELGGNVGVGYGRFNAFNVSGYVEAPLVEDKLAGSLNAFYRESGDWYSNEALGEDRGNREVFTVTGKLATIDTGALSGVFSLTYSEESNDGGEFVARDAATLESITGSFRDVQSPLDAFGENEQFRATFDASYDFGNDIVLRSITAYQSLKENNSFDLTGRGLLNRELNSDVDVFTQELQLRGQFADGAFEWVVGGMYFQEDAFQTVEDTVFFNTRAATVIDIDSKSISVFAEGTYNLSERTSITAGVRYTNDDKTLAGAMATPADPLTAVPVAAENDADAVTARFVVSHQFTDDIFGFVNVSRGFKAGSFNGLAVLNPQAFATGFDPETVWAYEVGMKADLADNTLRANINFFFNDFSDLQGLNTNSDGFTTINNVADANVYGIETEVTWLPTDGLQIFAALARQWDEYKNIDPTSVIQPDFRINRASEWTANLGFEYRHPVPRLKGDVGLVGNWAYRSSYFNDIVNAPVFFTEGHSLVDLGAFVEFEDSKWRVSVNGKNILNEKVYLKGLGVIGATGQPTQPATWMVNAAYNF